VKTTDGRERTPFHISANVLAASEEMVDTPAKFNLTKLTASSTSNGYLRL
jgi:hypothetical protein